MNGLTVGTVFKWKEFPHPRYDPLIKTRWFIYLGATNYFAQIATVYLCTTTTQAENYDPGGCRVGKSHIHFDTKNYPIFEKDCILDIDEMPYAIPSSSLDLSNVEIMGVLQENDMRMIYNKILGSEGYSKRVIIDIHDSFNRAGIINLKRPK